MLDTLYVSYDINEMEKDPSDPSKLGRILILCERRYTELDEIVDRFVEMMTVLVNDIIAFPKYRPLNDVCRVLVR